MFPRRGAPPAAAPLYVEDVFSAYTYTGNGASQSIVNDIDISGKGGLVWIKQRSAGRDHFLFDTARGAAEYLCSSADIASTNHGGTFLTGFNNNGFTLSNGNGVNINAGTYVGWSFRKAPKFFDIVTWSGNNTNRTIPHSLGIAPGMIIIKELGGTQPWAVYHQNTVINEYLVLSSTAAAVTDSTLFNSTPPTSDVFSIGTNGKVNKPSTTYIAYLFAHDTSSNGIIRCGTFAPDGSGNVTVNLGWEPQYILYKQRSATSNWTVLDSSRIWNMSGSDGAVYPNNVNAETSGSLGNPTATGFQIAGPAGGTWVYMAIRKGLMRTPSNADKVFAINGRTGTGAAATINAGLINQGVDFIISKARTTNLSYNWQDRLRGISSQLASNTTAVETTVSTGVTSFNMDNVAIGSLNTINFANPLYINYMIEQARGFFDMVAYTGTGTGVVRTENHNLAAVPELIIGKSRDGVDDWYVYYGDNTKILTLNTTAAGTTVFAPWNNTSPTNSVFTVTGGLNVTTKNFIIYLFASCPGVSKIGTYTGTAATLQIDCGFTAGARFVLIKRIDSTGDWYYWDTTRGIVSGNDPYLLMNSNATENASTDYIDPYNPGFEISSTAPAAINATGGTYLYWSIA